jgi:two-component system invasion response regulator UvrY
MSSKKNICVIDDHAVVRHGLATLVEKTGPYLVTHQFADGQELLDALPLKPEVDLLIMDVEMPVMTGEEVLKELNKRGVKIPVLVLTFNENERMVVNLFRNGARGYLRKQCPAAELGAAVKEVLERGYYHNEFLTFSLQNENRSSKKATHELILEQLSAREKEFLHLVCDENEYTYEQIADRMSVHHRTVDGYRESIFDKFHIKSKTGLVLFVLKHRLFDHLGAAKGV